MASRKITDLHPDLQPLCLAFLGKCAEKGIPLMITCTFRPQAEQDELYAQGRTKPGKIVTWVKVSKHSFTIDGVPASKAFDVAVLKDGKPTWDIKVSVNDNDIGDYLEIAEIGRRLGLRAGADFRDFPHFELKG